jgi:hypothetical protein
MPNAEKFISKRVVRPSQTDECSGLVMILQGRFGSARMARRRLQFTRTWQTACLTDTQYREYGRR